MNSFSDVQERVTSKSGMLLVGVVLSVHGIRGYVKIKTFTERPADIASYGPLLINGEGSFNVSVISTLKNGVVIAKISGFDSRTESEALRNKSLYMKRSNLPKLQEESFYVNELVGMTAKLEDDTVYGEITGVFNFGSCDIVELSTIGGKKVMFPFTPSVFPVVDTSKGITVIVPPDVVGYGK